MCRNNRNNALQFTNAEISNDKQYRHRDDSISRPTIVGIGTHRSTKLYVSLKYILCVRDGANIIWNDENWRKNRSIQTLIPAELAVLTSIYMITHVMKMKLHFTAIIRILWIICVIVWKLWFFHWWPNSIFIYFIFWKIFSELIKVSGKWLYSFGHYLILYKSIC